MSQNNHVMLYAVCDLPSQDWEKYNILFFDRTFETPVTSEQLRNLIMTKNIQIYYSHLDGDLIINDFAFMYHSIGNITNLVTFIDSSNPTILSCQS